MFKKLLLLIVVPVLLMAFARLATMPLLMHSWNSVVNYAPPFTEPLPPGRAGQPLSDQVVVVVVDALRADASQHMSALNGLRARGASLTMRVGQPSLSLPGWSVLGTGAWQERSGVTTNWFKGTVKTDSIFAQAKRSGLGTALVGSPDWMQLYGPYLDVSKAITSPSDAYTNPEAVAKQDDLALATALTMLKSSHPPALLLLHFAGPDDAGHGRGGASEVYRQVIQGIDGRIATLAAQMDLNRSTLIVTADHGTLDTGGHGGWEESVTRVPFVAVGKGIKAGAYPDGVQADVAPTLAVLLGTAIPAHSQGQALFDLLNLPDKARAERAFDVAQELASVQALYARQIGALPLDHTRLLAAEQALASGDFASSVSASRDFAQDVGRQADAAREARLQGERLRRTPVVILLLLPFVAWLLVIASQRLPVGAPLAGAAAYFLVYNGLFFGRGNQFSLSAFNSEDQIEAYFTQRGTDALVALLLAAVVAGLLSRRRSLYEAAMAGVNTMFFVALGLALQILSFYWYWDREFAWYLPDLAWGFKYYLDMLQTSVFWPLLYMPAGAIVPLVSAFLGRVGRAGSRG